MDCGGGSNFGGGCSSSGADFGGSHFGGMNTSHNTHLTSTTHSIFGAHPTSTTTQWTSTTVSGSGVHSIACCCVVVYLGIFFIGWFGVAGFLAYTAATNFSPFLALPPICIALLGFFCIVCIMYIGCKRQRKLSRGVVNVKQRTTPSQIHSPPHLGYPSSYPAGQQAPRPSPPPAGVPEEDNPPAYDDVAGGTTSLETFV